MILNHELDCVSVCIYTNVFDGSTAQKIKGKFQHSSFLAGGATTAAGRLVVNHGVLKLMEAHSGHYRPSPENFEALVGILVNRGTDLHLAKVQQNTITYSHLLTNVSIAHQRINCMQVYQLLMYV